MRLNLLVIKTHRLHELAEFYGWLGLQFDYHRHGKGVLHYSAILEGLVFEIYPLPEKISVVDTTTRLGWQVENLDNLMVYLRSKNVKILSEPTETEFGITAIIEDLDGRKIELSERRNLE